MASPIKISSALGKPRPGTFRQEQVAAFFLELRAPLGASLQRWKLSDQEVEDIVQETFVRLLVSGPKDLKAENARYWLFRVARNLAIDLRRSGWRNLLDSRANFDVLLSTHPGPHSNPEKIYLAQEQWQMVRDNLDRLTARQQHAIYLRTIGLSYKAIAHQLRGTSNSVSELVRRGLKRLGANGNSNVLGNRE
ncbi:MAG TPA: RNA polymerase sigma factor [Terriglobales bacterium]|nr:RNA polymerase sigma factor [Terriglobales bacterium]